MIWHYSKNGFYNSKSEHCVALEVVIPDFGALNGEDYRISRYPRRSNIFFLWRACQDCIPTQFRLLQRGIEINDVCVFCGSAGKTREHVLVTCPYACDLMSMFLLAVAGSGF